MTHQQIKERILKACEWAKAQGLKLAPGDWGIEQGVDGTWRSVEGYCCPLGALVLMEQPDADRHYSPTLAASQILGERMKWITNFTQGVDGGFSYFDDPDAFNLGREIIAEVSK